MNVANIISEALVLWYAESTQFSWWTTQLLTWLNFEYQKLCGDLKIINENYFYGRGYFDCVPYQNQYDFSLATVSIVAPQKMLNVSIKYQADTYPAWSASSAYTIGDKVMNNGKTYICNSTHTAKATIEYLNLLTLSAIMVAGETVTIQGITLTATAAGGALLPGQFAIGISQAACAANLAALINGGTGSASTFVPLSNTNQSIFTQSEIVASVTATNDVQLLSSRSLTLSETSTVWSRWAETNGWFTQIYENYTSARPQALSITDIDSNNDSISNNPFIDAYWVGRGVGNPVYALTSSNAIGGGNGNKMCLMIYPYPEEVIKSWIKFDYLKTIVDLEYTSTESEILIERAYHRVLVLALLPYIYQAKGMLNEKQLAIADYKEARNVFLAQSSDRVQGSTTAQIPNLIGIE